MKKASLVILAVVIAMIGASGAFLTKWRVQAVSININVKDLPEEGLKLVAPTDPSFEGRLSSILKNKPNALAEGLKLYSVLLENKGNKVIVGYRLKWEMSKADGTVSVRQAGGINMGALMDIWQPGSENPSQSGGFAIKPHAITFVSPAGSLSEDDSSMIMGYATGSTDRGTQDQIRQQAGDNRYAALISTVKAELQQYTSITISVDGVVFEDGGFVGPDTTGFFVSIQAYLNAKRDLLEEIDFAIKRNRGIDRIFSDIEEIANSEPSERKLNQADLYTFYKKMQAKEVLRLRTAMSDQRAMEMLQQQYRKQWPRFKKL
jgi:hypothetical protein